VVEVSGVSKRYGTLLALDSVSVRVSEGAMFALLGPNGAGKTTLIRIVTGLLARDGGLVNVFGMDPAKDREGIGARMGVVLENATIYPYMTGQRYLSFFAKLFHPGQSRSERDQRVDECLGTVGLTKVAKAEAGKYSHGMKKRLLFARALINDPELVILDEPLAGLDPIVARRLKDKMMELNREGRTILFSTHILTDAEELCSEIGILNHGRILAQEALPALRDRFPSRTFRIAVQEVDQALVNGFQSLGFIEGVRVESRESLLVQATDSLEVEEARRLIRENSPGGVLSVTLVPMSLDQVFLRLTAMPKKREGDAP
jgi:ABC-2 type transport system ATP-binding protein